MRYLVSFLVGDALVVALWVAFVLRPSPPGTTDVWGYDQSGSFILTMLPSAVIAAVAGGIASFFRTRLRHSAPLQPAAGGPQA